jgi:lysophospholipase L1-like esterase
MQIFCFGDSITYGFWDREGGWVERLRKHLEQKALEKSSPDNLNTESYVTVYNLGIPGDMSTGLIERVRGEFEARYNQDQESIFIFAIGINDTHYNSQADGYGVSLEEYKQNLKQLLQFAQCYSKKVVFIGLTPVDEKRANPIFWQTENYIKMRILKNMIGF